MTSSISSIIQSCLQQLDHIIVSGEVEKYQSDILPELWADELGRLRVWTANIGAHQTGQSSLDYRLRDASHLRDQTLRALGRLQRTIQDLQSVLHEPALNQDFSSDSEDGEECQNEIQEIYHSLRDTINVLFKTSMSIRRPAQHDKLLGVKRSDTTVFEPFDRQHVENKFPDCDSDVVDRLGLAISQRRATLRYRERHRRKLAQGLDQVLKDGDDSKSAMLSETVATEFVEKPAGEPLDMQSIVSHTSYGKTLIGGGSGPTIPSVPKYFLNGDPFECPYCFILITIKTKHSWAQHVFHDLMPYVCVFKDCQTPHRLWESRRQWFAHLQDAHSIPDDASVSLACPLCGISVNSGKSLERHLGRHLQELALFALPQSDFDEDDGFSIAAESEEILSQSSYDDGDEFVDTPVMQACKGCLKRKIKCDAPMTNTWPCSACNRLKLVCVPPTFPSQFQMKPMLQNQRVHTKMSGTNDLEPPILYTPTTHRISQAKKGKRVHACEYPGCNKVFTRAEHRRRHELNHSPESSYQRSHLDCEKAFFQDQLEHYTETLRLESSSEQSQNHKPELKRSNSDPGGGKPRSREGKTRFAKRLVHILAIMDLGYPFKEEEDNVVIMRVLSKAQIDEVISRSRVFQKPEDEETNAAHVPISGPNSRSNSGSGSAKASRKEDDKNMTLTLNGFQIGFTQEAVAGNSINIRAGDTGGVRLNIGAPSDERQGDNHEIMDETSGREESGLMEQQQGVEIIQEHDRGTDDSEDEATNVNEADTRPPKRTEPNSRLMRAMMATLT